MVKFCTMQIFNERFILIVTNSRCACIYSPVAPVLNSTLLQLGTKKGNISSTTRLAAHAIDIHT